MKHPVKLGTFIRPPFDYGLVSANVADQARETVARILSHEKAAAVDIGRELIAMKEALGHGHFIPWIEAEFGYTARTTQNLMQLSSGCELRVLTLIYRGRRSWQASR